MRELKWWIAWVVGLLLIPLAGLPLGISYPNGFLLAAIADIWVVGVALFRAWYTERQASQALVRVRSRLLAKLSPEDIGEGDGGGEEGEDDWIRKLLE